MRNLVLHDLQRQQIKNSEENVEFIALVDNYVYAVTDGKLIVYDTKDPSTEVTLTSNIQHVLQFQYVPTEKTLWIVCKTQFILVNVADNSLKRIVNYLAADCEICDLFEVQCAVWNDSQDSLAIVKGTGDVGVYSTIVKEGLLMEIETAHLYDAAPRVEELGWGSADRQYRSKKELLQIEARKGEEPIENDDGMPYISWRGNGEMFAVNYNCNGRRRIKVFNYPCTFMYQSEDVIGLQPIIAWKPVGNLIASTVWTTKRWQLVTFEKNCLEKSNFDLKDEVRVTQLKWSHFGDVLAVCHESTNDKSKCIDLYCFKNAVLYHKQRLPFHQQNPLICFEFLESVYSLYVLQAISRTEIITYSYKFEYSCSLINNKEQYMICVSLSGIKALMTRCQNGMIPPPAYDLMADVGRPINFVVFHPTKPMAAFVDCDNVISVYELKGSSLIQLGSFSLHDESAGGFPLNYHHFWWPDDAKIMCVVESDCSNSEYINTLTLQMDNDNTMWKCSQKSTTLSKGINSIVPFENGENTLAQIGNRIFSIKDESTPSLLATLPSSPLYLTCISVNDTLYIFSLGANNIFLINNVEVLDGVISFIVHSNYLFLSTASGKLFGIRLNVQSLEELTNKNFTNVYTRAIEQRSLLICGIPTTAYIAMQIGRGNIELCCCRLIVIDRVDNLMEKGAWGEALMLARSARLNMNALVDLNFVRFIKNIEKFIEAVKVPSVLIDFLLGLQDENVFQTVYNNCGITSESVLKKRELICDCMINHMGKTNFIYYLNVIITACFVKNTAKSAHEALFYLQAVLDCAKNDRSLVKVADDAFKNACTFKSSKELYENALLTYDLDLVLFVARISGMDPLEFKPFIKDLKESNLLERKFKVNDYLRKYFDAFQYLAQYAEDEVVLDYIKQYNLFEQALWQVKPNSLLYTEVSRMLAERLSSQREYKQAAIFYERVGLLEEALQQYENTLYWEDVLLTMHSLDKSKDCICKTLSRVAAKLVTEGQVRDAAEVYEKHLNDYETAIMVCIKAKLFSHAVHLALKYKRQDIFEADITTAVYEYCATLCDKFKAMLEEFKKNKARLSTVIAGKKANSVNNFAGGPNMSSFDEIGSIADSSTVASLKTSSSRTSRNRRKTERKKHSMREGGLYEDVALVQALHNLVNEAYQWGPKVRELCLLALRFNHVASPSSSVISMYHSLVQLQAEVESGCTEIWPQNFGGADSHVVDVNLFQNLLHLDPKYCAAPKNTSGTWRLRAFPSII